MRKRLGGILILLVCGCGVGGPPRFDGSSQAAANKSVDRLSAGMTQAQKEEFGRDVLALTALPAMRAAFKGGISKAAAAPAPDPVVYFKPIDGLTAAEIHEKAKATRAELAK